MLVTRSGGPVSYPLVLKQAGPASSNARLASLRMVPAPRNAREMTAAFTAALARASVPAIRGCVVGTHDVQREPGQYEASSIHEGFKVRGVARPTTVSCAGEVGHLDDAGVVMPAASVDGCAASVSGRSNAAQKICALALGSECAAFLTCAKGCGDASCVIACGVSHATGKASATELSSCMLTAAGRRAHGETWNGLSSPNGGNNVVKG